MFTTESHGSGGLYGCFSGGAGGRVGHSGEEVGVECWSLTFFLKVGNECWSLFFLNVGNECLSLNVLCGQPHCH